MTRKCKGNRVNIETGVLETLGLSENEILLYTNMLQMQKATVRELGTLGLFPRTMLYHVLNQLIGKGLVESFDLPSKKTTFTAKDPENLYQLLHKKEQDFKHNAENIKELIPKLKTQFSLFGTIPNIRTFHGVLGYENALEDIFISKPDCIYAYENFHTKKTGIEVRQNFENRRVLKKLKKDVVFFDSKENLQKLKEIVYNDYTNYRGVLGEELQEFNTDLILYSNKLLYTVHNGHEPACILIEDKSLFAMQKSLFKNLWATGKNRTLYYTQV